MKKKFLSLMMAAAVVATTSVSAFAKDYNVEDTQEIEHNVTVTGDVANDQNITKPGTIQVTVPTAAAFKVDNKGAFTSPDIVINNSGAQKVDVLAYRFVDTNGTSGINVKKKNEVVTDTRSDVKRSEISLSLKGNGGTVYFKSEDDKTKSGIFSDESLEPSVEVTDGYKISSILPNGGQDNLKLIGEAGQQERGISQPIQDTFTLTLKIVKSKN